MRSSRLTAALLVAVIFLGSWQLYPKVRAAVLSYEQSPAARGRQLAEQFGCFSCHGPEGRGGVPNPGSHWETVPSFGEQTLMMFVVNDGELREYILDSAPARKRRDPAYAEEMKKQALHMPAFRGFVSDGEVDDLVAYVRATSGMLSPPEAAVARGAAVVQRLGCFHCHGDMGIGGRNNPGSLKGYIPGFFGEDFRDLVRSDEELLSWIRDGVIERITDHPIGGYFFSRQRIRMPAYKEFASDAEITDAAAYVRWLASGAWQKQPLE